MEVEALGMASDTDTHFPVNHAEEAGCRLEETISTLYGRLHPLEVVCRCSGKRLAGSGSRRPGAENRGGSGEVRDASIGLSMTQEGLGESASTALSMTKVGPALKPCWEPIIALHQHHGNFSRKTRRDKLPGYRSVTPPATAHLGPVLHYASRKGGGRKLPEWIRALPPGRVHRRIP